MIATKQAPVVTMKLRAAVLSRGSDRLAASALAYSLRLEFRMAKLAGTELKQTNAPPGTNTGWALRRSNQHGQSSC